MIGNTHAHPLTAADVVGTHEAVQLMANDPWNVAVVAFRQVSKYLRASGPAISFFKRPSEVDTEFWSALNNSSIKDLLVVDDDGSSYMELHAEIHNVLDARIRCRFIAGGLISAQRDTRFLFRGKRNLSSENAEAVEMLTNAYTVRQNRGDMNNQRLLRGDKHIGMSAMDDEGLLYLGNIHDVMEDGDHRLKEMGIQHVITVCGRLPDKRARQLDAMGIRRRELGLEDVPSEAIHMHFDDICSCIQQAFERREPVLVHCMAGISRSATFVLAFLMKHRGMRLLEAFEYVLERRPIVQPNVGFARQLLDLERELLGCASAPWSEYLTAEQFLHHREHVVEARAELSRYPSE